MLYSIIQRLFPNILIRIPDTGNTIYLTFDDGPTPDVTSRVLSTLKQYNAKATFFCVGKNIEKHPGLYQCILDDGHRTGNHTYDHSNGWKTETKEYVKSVVQCQELIKEMNKSIFRPPYGKLSLLEFFNLQFTIKNLKFVFWDVLSKDYDHDLSPEQCFRRVKEKTKPGSIVVFHDSVKASKNLYTLLPKALDYFSEKGFAMKVIP